MIKSVFFKVIVVMCFFTNSYAASSINNYLTTFVKNVKEEKIVVRLNNKVVKNLQKKSSIVVHVPGYSMLEFKIKKVKKRKNGSIKWKGRNKDKKAKILLTYMNGSIFGEIRIQNIKYKITQKKNKKNTYIIFKEDKTKSIKFHNDTIVPKAIFKKYEPLDLNGENEKLVQSQINQIEIPSIEKDIVNGKTIIDVIILYTQEFLDYYGVNTDTRIQYLLDVANDGFENSQTDVELNLVHSELFNDANYSESYSIGSVLPNMIANDDIKALKRKYKADIVSLFRRYKDSGTCGLAYLLNETSSSYAKGYAYNIVEDRQEGETFGGYCSDLTFVHEIGHNFGCAHDIEHSSNNGLFDYSYGHDEEGNFATIMSYDPNEINYFSNPSLSHNSSSIGIENEADNARTIRETKYYLDNQFEESLESGEQITGNILQGVLSDVEDRDLFQLTLEGEVTFSGIQNFYMSIYDKDGYLVLLNGVYPGDFTHNFTKGDYELVVLSINENTGQYFDNINQNYSISYTISIPVAKAGDDQIVEEGEPVSFDASSSFDMNGTIISYEWKEDSIVISTSEIFTKSDFTVGTHTIILTVTDNEGNSSTDDIIITITPLDTNDDGEPDFIDDDDDGDGMPDIYENENGLNPLVDDSGDDLDNDGKSNLEEYEANTNPDDENSRVYVLSLKAGWNLVALELDSIVDLTNLGNEYIEVIRTLENTDEWIDWIKNSSSNVLTTLEDGNGYWIKVSQDTTLDILGDGDPNKKAIVEGQWNMLGSHVINDFDYFFSNNPDIKIVWTYDAMNQEYKAISSDSTIQSDLDSKSITIIDEIESNDAFFVK